MCVSESEPFHNSIHNNTMVYLGSHGVKPNGHLGLRAVGWLPSLKEKLARGRSLRLITRQAHVAFACSVHNRDLHSGVLRSICLSAPPRKSLFGGRIPALATAHGESLIT